MRSAKTKPATAFVSDIDCALLSTSVFALRTRKRCVTHNDVAVLIGHGRYRWPTPALRVILWAPCMHWLPAHFFRYIAENATPRVRLNRYTESKTTTDSLLYPNILRDYTVFIGWRTYQFPAIWSLLMRRTNTVPPIFDWWTMACDIDILSAVGHPPHSCSRGLRRLDVSKCASTPFYGMSMSTR